MGKSVAIVGTGQTYHKSRRLDVNGVELIHEAVSRALEDADLTRDDIDLVIIGNMDHFEGINYVDMWSIDGSGGFMKPTIKLTTGGTTGSTLAIAGYHMVASGLFEKAMVIGWEKNSESDTTAAINTAFDPIWDRLTFAGAIGGLALEASVYMNDFGITEKDAARVSVRDRRHACKNPHAHLRTEVTVEDVLNSPMLCDPIKLLDICPRSDGACAVIFASEDVAEGITSTLAWVWGVANRHMYHMINDVNLHGLHSLKNASKELYQKCGIREPLKEIDVLELYQPYSFGGLLWLESMGLCKDGEAPRLVWDGITDMDGILPVNPSGGVIATNPIGATGLIRCAEAAMQIMGKAGERQIPDVEIAVSTGFGGCMWSDVLLYGKKIPQG